MGEEVLKCVDSHNPVAALHWSINRRTVFFLFSFCFSLYWELYLSWM